MKLKVGEGGLALEPSVAESIRSDSPPGRDHTESLSEAEGRRGLIQPTYVGAGTRFVKGTTLSKPPNTDGAGIWAMLMHPLCLLLVCLPLGVASRLLHWGDVWTFWFNFAALIPMAKILGDATEELAAGLKSDVLAGLLNATFGNAVEMVIMVQTLRAGYTEIVKATLLGSVLSNLLLVLGMSFFCGGLVTNRKRQIIVPSSFHRASVYAASNSRASVTFSNLNNVPPPPEQQFEEMTYTEFVGEKVQTFSAMTALVNTSMLLLSCLSFSLVTVFASETSRDGKHLMESVLVPVSRTCSCIIIVAYVAYIFFQLVTHREKLSEQAQVGGAEDEEEEEPRLSIGASVTIMFITTIAVAYASELLVSSLEEVVDKTSLSRHFIGIILLPIIGNACEHASAIRFAIMDKPGLSIGIAVGSSTQIALFVVPFSVLCGWAIGREMDLNFGSLNTTVMSISVLVVLSVVVDGTANWLQGYLLISAYLVAAVLYWYLPDELS